MIENKQKINKIIMKPKAICFCPLGDDWYTNEFYITFCPSNIIPDYCDVERYIEENIRGKKLIIENAIDMVYTYLLNTYHPVYLQVISRINDATSHFAVEVIK